MPETDSQWLTVSTSDGPMRVFAARPSRPTGRAVVVLQEAFGVNEHIQDVTRRLAHRGYLAVAPDLFHRTGPSAVPYDDRATAMALIADLGFAQVTEDVGAALRLLEGQEGIDAAHSAVVGFCFGGRAAFAAAAATPGLGAAVVFYGPGIAAGPYAMLDRAGAMSTPLLMHVGADDPTIPSEQVTAIQEATSGGAAELTLHTYPEAGHAFACDARPAMFREAAARLAWERTYDFLDDRLAVG